MAIGDALSLRQAISRQEQETMARAYPSAIARDVPEPDLPSMPAPILYLINQYPAVTHTFIRREIMALERRGHRVARISLRVGQGIVDPLDIAERDRTIRLLEHPAGLAAAVVWSCLMRPVGVLKAAGLALRLMHRSARSRLQHLAALIEACAVAREMRREGIRHVHAHFGTNPAEIALLAATIAGGRYSFTVHGYDEYDKPEFLGLDLKIRHAAFVAAVSHYGRSQLLRWCDPADRGKIGLVRCGLDAESFVRTANAGSPESTRFVCVARLCREKAQETLVAAVAALALRGIEASLTLVGDGDGRPDVEAMIARLGLGDRIRLIGWRTGEEVRAEIAAARALVVPSFAENLPVVIMEAMALGKPVIATAIAGIPELVVPGETGWLVPASSVENLADAMADCLSMAPAELERMGVRGRERVRRQHDVDREVAILSALFRT